jgi:AraC-like DNA-binding protein
LSLMENKEKINFVRPPALDGVELMVAKASTRHWRVYHEQYAICANDDVAAEIRYRKKSNPILTRSTSLFEPGETHDTHRVAKPQDFTVLFLSADYMQRLSEEMDISGLPHFKPNPNTQEKVYESCKRLHASILEDGISSLEQESRLIECIGMLLSNHAEKRLSPLKNFEKTPIYRAREFLNENFANSVSLNEVASIAGLSRFHFLKTFSAEFGLPPHTYHIHLRIERSLPLLRMGMSLSHAAETLGFNDQSHFIRHFKRIMGITPGQYKAIVKSV